MFDFYNVKTKVSDFKLAYKSNYLTAREVGNISEVNLLKLYEGNFFPSSFLAPSPKAVDINNTWYQYNDDISVTNDCFDKWRDIKTCYIIKNDFFYIVKPLFIDGAFFNYFVSYRSVIEFKTLNLFSVCSSGNLCIDDYLGGYLLLYNVSLFGIFSLICKLIKSHRINKLDNLSGLKRRDCFSEKKVDKRVQALCFLDIDHFKNINDTYGHDIGDEAIKAFSNTLKKNIRETDVAFRWGGEEFLIIFRSNRYANVDIYCLVERLRHSVEVMKVKGLPHFTVSIGYCHYDRYIDVKSLIKQADVAMYQSKINGRNKVTKYNSSMSNPP